MTGIQFHPKRSSTFSAVPATSNVHRTSLRFPLKHFKASTSCFRSIVNLGPVWFSGAKSDEGTDEQFSRRVQIQPGKTSKERIQQDRRIVSLTNVVSSRCVEKKRQWIISGEKTRIEIRSCLIDVVFREWSMFHWGIREINWPANAFVRRLTAHFYAWQIISFSLLTISSLPMTCSTRLRIVCLSLLMSKRSVFVFVSLDPDVHLFVRRRRRKGFLCWNFICAHYSGTNTIDHHHRRREVLFLFLFLLVCWRGEVEMHFLTLNITNEKA